MNEVMFETLIENNAPEVAKYATSFKTADTRFNMTFEKTYKAIDAEATLELTKNSGELFFEAKQLNGSGMMLADQNAF